MLNILDQDRRWVIVPIDHILLHENQIDQSYYKIDNPLPHDARILHAKLDQTNHIFYNVWVWSASFPEYVAGSSPYDLQLSIDGDSSFPLLRQVRNFLLSNDPAFGKSKR